MKNAKQIYLEYMERLKPAIMELVILETEDWTNNFAIIKTDWRNEVLKVFNVTVDYTIYWIPDTTKRPQPIKCYTSLNQALTAFHILRYENATYTEFPF